MLAALAAAALGCAPEAKPAASEPVEPGIKVNLPPSPKLDEPPAQDKYADGTWTVEGLVRNRAKTIDTDVRLKGYVLSVARCPPERPLCDPPAHAVLVDDVARPRRRLVVLADGDEALAGLASGQGVTLEGRYVRLDPQGRFVRMDGLLMLAQPTPPTK